MKYTFTIVPLFVLAALFTACKKGDSGQPGVAVHTPVYVPTSIINNYTGGYDNRYFYYDDKDRLIELKEVTTTKTTDSKFTYNDNDQIIQATWADTGSPTSTSNLTYYADSIAEYYTTPGRISIHYTHLLNAKKQIVQTSPNNGDYDNFKYDDRGNMIVWDRYTTTSPGKPTLFSSTTFTYDNNKNPFVNVKGNYIIAFNHYVLFGFITNNMLSYSASTTPFVYTFDSNGYPTNLGPLFSGTLTYTLQ